MNDKVLMNAAQLSPINGEYWFFLLVFPPSGGLTTWEGIERRYSRVLAKSKPKPKRLSENSELEKTLTSKGRERPNGSKAKKGSTVHRCSQPTKKLAKSNG